MNVADEIGKLNKLKEDGALTEEEFQQAKTSLLSKNDAPGAKFKKTVDDVATDTNMWGMFIHLSQFAGLMIPYAGLILPIVLWQIKKDESKVIDQHGRIVTNWIITETIVLIALFILTVITFGLGGIVLFAFGIVAVVFPIMGAVKANNGEVWSYPMSIKFFPLENGDTPEAPASAPAQSTPPEAPAPAATLKPSSDES